MNWRDGALRILTLWWRLTRPCTIGVRGIVLNDAGEMLLVRHSYGGRQWFLPGGGHRGGESPHEALVREMREETGLEVRITGLTGIYFDSSHYKRDHIYIFTCQVTGGDVRLVGGEIDAIRWFPPDHLPPNRMPGMDRILRDWRQGVVGYGNIR